MGVGVEARRYLDLLSRRSPPLNLHTPIYRLLTPNVNYALTVSSTVR